MSTLLSTSGISACMLVHSLWFCLHYFMEFSVVGDMTLRPGSSVFVERSWQRERLGGVCGWRPIRRQSAGVWDPDSSSGSLVWLVRLALAPRAGNAAHFPFRGAHAGVEFRPGRLGRGGGGLAPERPAVVRIPMTAGQDASRPQGRKARSLSMFQPATIPEPIMRSLSLAKWYAGSASRASCRNWWALLPRPSHQLTKAMAVRTGGRVFGAAVRVSVEQ